MGVQLPPPAPTLSGESAPNAKRACQHCVSQSRSSAASGEGTLWSHRRLLQPRKLRMGPEHPASAKTAVGGHQRLHKGPEASPAAHSVSGAALFACMMDDPLHATIEELGAEGYTHVSCHCPRCRMTRLRTMMLPRISMGLTFRRLRCAKCRGRCSGRGDRRTCLGSRWTEGG